MECSLRSSGCLTSAFAVSRSIFSAANCCISSVMWEYVFRVVALDAGEFILAPLRKKAEELNCILCEPKYSATEGALMLAMERFPLSPS